MTRLSDTVRIIETTNGQAAAMWCPACQMLHAVPITGSNAWSFNHDQSNPTLTPSVPVRVVGGLCHFSLTDGRINFHGDSTHVMAGQSAVLAPLPPEYAAP